MNEDPRRPVPGERAVVSASDPLRRVAEVMHAVRERCVWTQGMTHRELLTYLVEESYELVDAVERGSRAELREELGDLLWQVVFHAEIASEDPRDSFSIDDVADALAEKMIRRHPHVFGGETARTPEEVLVLWNAAKAAEKRERRSVLEGIPASLPALARADRVLGRAAKVLGSAPDVDPAARVSADPAADPASEAELGERLLDLVRLARARGWDAERALRERLHVLEAGIRAAEDPSR